MRTVSKPDGLYGCNTEHPDYKPRKDGRWIQDGWEEIEVAEKVMLPCLNMPGYAGTTYRPTTIRVPKIKKIPDRMSRECDYDRWACDPYCKGCKKANCGVNPVSLQAQRQSDCNRSSETEGHDVQPS